MGVTFINKLVGPAPCVGKAAHSNMSVASAKSAEMPVQPAAKLRNDLLPGLPVWLLPLGNLVAARHPVRKPSRSQLARVARSIRRLGFRTPILVGKDGEIIDGHTRVEAARLIGLEEIPCIVAEDLAPEEIRLLRIALNRIQERGVWDETALKLELAYILEFEPDLTVTGFEAPEIDRLLVLDEIGADETDPLDDLRDLPDADATAVTRPGDLWRLGSHRVLCGNARNMEDVLQVAGDRTPAAVFTDPPYNVAVNGHITVGKGKFAEFAEASGEMSEGGYEDFLRVTSANMAKVIKPGGVLFLCIDWRHAEVLMRVLRSLGLDLINTCVWAKDKPGMGSLYRSQHELVLVAKRPGAPHLNNVQLGIHGRNRSNVWRYAGATGGRKAEEDDFSLHPTVKPVRLVRDALLDVTAMGDLVLDPFMGSGTTVLAAELSKRVCAGIEISPAYVDVAIGRWERLTGLEAVHAETGLTFAELQDVRGPGDAAGRTLNDETGGAGKPIGEDF